MAVRNKYALKNITDKAKRIYKKGKAGVTWIEAIRKASSETKRKKVGSIKILQRGEKRNTPVKKVLMQTRNKTKGTFTGYKVLTGIECQLGAIRKGSKFIYYKGVQIEKMPIVTTKGRRKETKCVYITHGKVHHSLRDAEASIRTRMK